MDALFAGSILGYLYVGALLLGFLYALFLLFFQGITNAFDIHIGDLTDGDADFDLGHDVHVHADVGGGGEASGDEVVGLSMLAVSGFITAFGAFGLGSSAIIGSAGLLSLAFALIGGVVVGAAAQLLFVHVISPTISVNIKLDDTVKGNAGYITVSVPASGLGQVATVLEGQRMTLSARSSNGEPLKQGTEVVIDSVRENVAYVSVWDEPQQNTYALEALIDSAVENENVEDEDHDMPPESEQLTQQR